MYRTRTLAWFAALLLTGAMSASAEVQIADKGDQTVSLYGFLKLDATYQSDGMNSLFAPRFATGGDGGTNFTAMHSRFGVRWKGPESDGGLKVGGVLEWDLFDSSKNQMKFRTRLAALTLKKGNSEWMFGQHWDVFSPINATTLMTNGNLWQTGNLGFRRAQIRYTNSGERGEFAFSLNDPTSEGATDSQVPVIETRFGLKFGQGGKLGLSGAYGQDQRTVDGREEDLDIAGISLDWIVPFGGGWSLKGEAASGENLSIFLSRAGVYEDPLSGRLESSEVTAAWTELLYSGSRGNFWLGYAVESLDEAVDAGRSVDSRTLGRP